MSDDRFRYTGTYFPPGTKLDALPKTNGKAWMSSGITFVSVLGAMWGYGDGPAAGEVERLVLEVGIALVTAAASWVGTWWKSIYAK